MRRLICNGSVLTLLLSLFVVGSVEAQDAQGHTVTDAELRSAVTSKVEKEGADRALLKRVLSTEQVRSVGEDAGLDVERARSAVGLLDGAALGRVAALAQDVDDQLAGGQSTVTITTTTIILVLLILILLIVA